MESLLKDARFALRLLRRQYAFAATAIATLALGIGASTAIFSVVESTLLRPLPFRTPERLAFAWGVYGPERDIRGASYVEVLDWRRMNRALENVSIYDETSLNLRTTAGAERIEAEMVSASFFSMFGATAQRGRTFTAAEDSVPNAFPVVVISDRMWRSRFGADPGIVGRTLTFNDVSFTVLGVLRPGFNGLSFDTDVWFPAAMVQANGGPADLSLRANRWLGAVARLEDGVTMEQAQHDVDDVAARLAKEHPDYNTDRGIRLFTLRQSYLGSTENLLLAVFGAVGLLLLIACANVAGLQLVRGAARQQEMALRLAIGAERGRLMQQLVVEGTVLSLFAAAAGMIVAYWGLESLLLLAPEGTLPPYAVPSLNLTAFAFALLVALGCGVVFGVVPAIRGARVSLVGALKEGARGSSGAFGGSRFGSQQLLVVAEAAFALVLMVGAGLFVRSLQKSLAVSLGFDARNLVHGSISLPSRYTPELRLQLAEQLEARIRALPSVRAVAVGSDFPFGGSSNGARIYVPETQQAMRYFRHFVSPGYFGALGVRIVEGRGVEATDRAGTPQVVTISESAARRFWPNERAVGKRLRLSDARGIELTVVGVVADFRNRDLTTALPASEPDVYFPLAQRPTAELSVGVRSDMAAESVIRAVHAELAALDPSLVLSRPRPVQDLVDQQTAGGRFASSVLAMFGATALVLTAVGLYGVLAFIVSLRRREIGIRIALGATRRKVMRQVIGYGLSLIGAGVGIGVVAAAWVTDWIASQLFGVRPHDPLVFISVPLILLAIAAVASWLPARRAAGVDPQIALRLE